MALGDTYNNNERKNYSPSVSSGYRFSNPESNIDKTSLSFTYWNKLLKVSIAPKKETDNDTISFDYENAGSVYLSHTKAFILYKEMINFLDLYEEGKSPTNAGVSTGSEGLIYICDGTEFSADGPCLVVRRIDENGNCTSTFVYEFRRNTHSSVLNYTEKTKSFETNSYELLEIEQIINLLKSYYEAMTMAIAYSVQETNKYDNSRINTKLKIIGEKLGVEFNSQRDNNRNRNSNTSYFNSAKSSNSNNDYNGGSTSYENGTLDDIG